MAKKAIKLISLLLLFTLSLPIHAADTAPRYQIYDNSVGVFLLDTKTGETWRRGCVVFQGGRLGACYFQAESIENKNVTSAMIEKHRNSVKDDVETAPPSTDHIQK